MLDVAAASWLRQVGNKQALRGLFAFHANGGVSPPCERGLTTLKRHSPASSLGGRFRSRSVPWTAAMRDGRPTAPGRKEPAAPLDLSATKPSALIESGVLNRRPTRHPKGQGYATEVWKTLKHARTIAPFGDERDLTPSSVFMPQVRKHFRQVAPWSVVKP